MPALTSPPDPGAGMLLGDALVRTMKLLHAMKQYAPRAHPDVDPMAYPVLFTLSVQPLRLSDLAERVYADVSTMSRQVTHLVGLGLVDRLPDPEDGRAHRLTLTDEGIQLLADLRASRETWIRGHLEGWSESDIRTFAGYLERFADAVAHSRAELLHEHGTPSSTLTPSTPTSQDVS